VRAAALPPGDDPDTLLAREGAEALRAVVEQAPAGLDLAIAEAVAPGCATPEQKADALRRVVPLVAKVSDAAERTAWAQRAALATGTREADVEAAVREVARGARVDDTLVVPQGPVRASPEERHLDQLVQALLQHPACAAEIDAPSFAASLEPSVSRELVQALLAACTSGVGADGLMTALEGRLGEAARVRLHALAASSAPEYEPAQAARAVRDIVARFDRRRRRERQRARLDEVRRAASSEEAMALLRSGNDVVGSGVR